MTIYTLNLPPDDVTFLRQDVSAVSQPDLGNLRLTFAKEPHRPISYSLSWQCDGLAYAYLMGFYRRRTKYGTLPFYMDLIGDGTEFTTYKCIIEPGSLRLQQQRGDMWVVVATVVALHEKVEIASPVDPFADASLAWFVEDYTTGNWIDRVEGAELVENPLTTEFGTVITEATHDGVGGAGGSDLYFNVLKSNSVAMTTMEGAPRSGYYALYVTTSPTVFRDVLDDGDLKLRVINSGGGFEWDIGSSTIPSGESGALLNLWVVFGYSITSDSTATIQFHNGDAIDISGETNLMQFDELRIESLNSPYKCYTNSLLFYNEAHTQTQRSLILDAMSQRVGYGIGEVR